MLQPSCVYYFVALYTFCYYDVSQATLSGLYVDNGIDQTIIQRVMTKQEKRDVEHELLNLLGLPDRPRIAPSVPLASSAPKFMLDIYKSLLEPPGNRSRRSEFNLSGRDLHAIDESDAIMSFPSHSGHVTGVRHERGKRLWFDVSEVPAGELIVGAELRLFQVGNQDKPDKKYTITVYKLISIDKGEKELQYVAAMNTTSRNERWLLFNVTGALITWVAFPDSNLGLYLSVHQVGRPSHEVNAEEVGIVSSKGEEERKPFMVAFFKSDQREVQVRTTRDTGRRRKKAESTPADYAYSHPISDVPFHWSSRSCQIHTLYVNFEDLKWHEWIIAPVGYSAFYCSGECNFPLNAHMNATNHAIVQTLVHLMNPQQYPKPCCAPTKLSSISVLYFVDDSNVILKKYKNMVVKSCGCH